MTTGKAAPRRKGPHACTVIAGLLAAGLLLVGGLVAYGIHRVYQDPQLRNVAEAVEEGVDIMVEARTAPGTDELRELGCDEALVLDVDRMRKLMNRFDAGVPPVQADEPKLWVTCQVGSFGAAPSCKRAALTFAGAARPTEPCEWLVEKTSDRETGCLEKFTRRGASLEWMGGRDAGAP
jgi:hypothetical protein